NELWVLANPESAAAATIAEFSKRSVISEPQRLAAAAWSVESSSASLAPQRPWVAVTNREALSVELRSEWDGSPEQGATSFSRVPLAPRRGWLIRSANTDQSVSSLETYIQWRDEEPFG
ncbi:MAG TPA: hypothetical protein PKD54_01450, partial [Pirellulaceae bacterium]|nr:hypothetical protein [Pirellulaceae bacterium]